ncbi:MAG: carboxylesterase family protein [bacterium]|nr:carboxylesterase family protein [bacterium]
MKQYRRVKNLSIVILLLLVSIGFSSCFNDPDAPGNGSAALSSLNSENSPLIRNTSYGTIKGKEWDSDTFAWLGIPYAKPPVGDLRWKAPRDPEPWQGERDASEFCEPCTQYGGLILTLDSNTYGKVVGSEDCLYLNIWRPQNNDKDLPVFFWIHGGMNSTGEAATSMYHGANLAKKHNMIVVSINYRLGILGWFYHTALQSGNALDDSGNYGTLDMIKALEWLRENIAEFGGDPGNVTIAGESAGGYNVISLMGSPLAAGLFHRAVSQSPASALASSCPNTAHLVAQNLLVKRIKQDGLVSTNLGALWLINKNGASWTADYLRGKSAEDLFSCSTRYSSIGVNEIGLLLDTTMSGRVRDGTVIPNDFGSRFKNGTYNRVPYLVGSNSEEVKIFEVAFGIITNLDEYEVADLIKNFNPHDPEYSLNDLVPPISQPLYQFLGATVGDQMFKELGIDPVIKDIALHQDVYVYRFLWNEQPAPMDFVVGASHMMEIPFMFGNFQTDSSSMFRFAWYDENRHSYETLGNAMTTYWANFAAAGNPNEGDPVAVDWIPWSAANGAGRIMLDSDIYMAEE